MELPNLGKNCSFWQCNKLDFLPVKCDACQNIFCKDHYSYVHHSCPNRHLRDNQIPMCPLCSKAVPVKFEKGETADQVVGRHIDNDCQSDAAEMKRKKVYNNRCNVKGCKQKEMIKFECYKCQLNFCLKHRLDIDHSCKG
ncbi:hypothetical protein HELRODRAFT_124735, partial [Helobdella robusta]|uniref:AN1-type domain-containing protein n=1 Tax=Helobdella robusta TaxID=6412 RepID=T1EH26_HELRO